MSKVYFQNSASRVTSVDSASTDAQYPSAKCVYGKTHCADPFSVPDAWSASSTAVNPFCHAIAYGDGRFVASFGDHVAVSTDGISWTEQSSETSPRLACLAYWPGTGSGGRFFGGDSSSDARIWYSGDGVTWTESQSPAGRWNAVACGSDGTFIAASDAGLYRSTDHGVTWTQCEFGATTKWTGVVAADGSGDHFIAHNESYGSCTSSDHGVSWNMTWEAYWESIAGNGNGTMVACFGDEYGGMMYKDGPGDTWKSTSETTGNWYKVAYGGGTFLAVKSGGNLYRSTDGITWTAVTGVTVGTSMAYGGGKFVAGDPTSNIGMKYCTHPSVSPVTGIIPEIPGKIAEAVSTHDSSDDAHSALFAEKITSPSATGISTDTYLKRSSGGTLSWSEASGGGVTDVKLNGDSVVTDTVASLTGYLVKSTDTYLQEDTDYYIDVVSIPPQ